MNWPKLALTKAQQAPSGCAAQASRPGDSQTALISVHWMNGTSTESATTTPMMVRMVLPIELKRLALSHGTTPCTRVGGGSAGAICWRTKNTSVCDCTSLMGRLRSTLLPSPLRGGVGGGGPSPGSARGETPTRLPPPSPQGGGAPRRRTPDMRSEGEPPSRSPLRQRDAPVEPVHADRDDDREAE